MSDTSQGPRWWQASDGKWYEPEDHPDYRPPSTPASPAPVSERPAVKWESSPAAGHKAVSTRSIVLAVLAPIILATVVVIVANSDNSTNGDAKSGSISRSGPQEMRSLGQTFNTGAFDVTVNRVIDPFHPPGAEALRPSACASSSLK